MSIFDATDDLFVNDDIFGKHTKRQDKAFKPWHKPRKQYIRDKQWADSLLRLLNDSKYKNIDTIKYFGLPGGDLLDVNYIHKRFNGSDRAKNKTLGVYGFIKDNEDFQKAQGELSKLLDKEKIANNSNIVQFCFEDIYNRKSDAISRIQNYGTYHFINLDFCDNVLTNDTLSALFTLIRYQLDRVAGIPWLLCITTRLNRESSNIDLIEKLQTIVNELGNIQDTNDKLDALYKEVHKHIKSSTKISEIDDKALINQLLQIGFVLWVIKEANTRKHKVELKSTFKYSVNLYDREQDMHSFVFRLQQPESSSVDTLGLVKTKGEAKPIILPSYSDAACETIEKLSKTHDVDDYFDGNKLELQKYAEQMKELLDECGYDTANYYEEMKSLGYIFADEVA
ncbi:PP_RS20740 family protein [Vibrio fluvialis]|uniref:PP_RS20740 family protein n=1 Tax=Vibrio fluvialis TaxID=676 RepID=UPI001123C085|nr:hypothetical protein [Vibrio fluvialis]EKO3431562.1 hypothetical protein [Vibrio fluvialis]ELG2962953.1 hypothetical protein [Vibrio fluvialis]ELI1830394.1 hypothetical protein [Vibrio fluvialis]TOY93227.1 hypothetical protein DJ016_12585 [Vibrio fluvialis]TRN10635.1 hypothetical protein DM587_15430 [Vibrio fluvialis]